MEFKLYEDNFDFETVAEIQDKPLNPNTSRRKHSYVWRYFRPIQQSQSFECVICKSCVGKQTSNLARHLAISHDITQIRRTKTTQKEDGIKRSFIWNYCSKENIKYARCNLCKKLLYFGGGNISNIRKHLRRKHRNLPEVKKLNMDETSQAIASIDSIETFHDEDPNSEILVDCKDGVKYADIVLELPARKERKGSSYVWNYCIKLSRNTIKCKLCSKIMSFHGTANVITHLQRKHNILGKLDENSITMDSSKIEIDAADESLFNITDERHNRRSAGTMSIVWKYCTRIGKDVVRCGFCKKNLSYQGTSNLQRHLHRMHGVATQSRSCRGEDSKKNMRVKMLSSDIIWEHCMVHEDNNVKCNMCNELFDARNMETISKHLSLTHSVMQPKTDARRRIPKRGRSVDINSDDYDDEYDDNWSNKDEETDSNAAQVEVNIEKKDESFYDEIIVEEHDEMNCDEDPFYNSEIHIENPLSPQTSREGSPDIDSSKLVVNSRKLQRLNEERIQMETEYLREKAAFYRMQKYVAALQARKIRLEMERLTGCINTNNITTYTMDISTEN